MESQKCKLWEVSVDKARRMAFFPDILLFSGIELHIRRAVACSQEGSWGEGSGLDSATSCCSYIQEARDFPATIYLEINALVCRYRQGMEVLPSHRQYGEQERIWKMKTLHSVSTGCAILRKSLQLWAHLLLWAVEADWNTEVKLTLDQVFLGCGWWSFILFLVKDYRQ